MEPLAWEMLFKGFSIFSSGSHFVQRSGTILAILVEGHSRNIPIKLFQNPLTGYFLFLALVAILFSGTKPF